MDEQRGPAAIKPPETITRGKLREMMACIGLADYWDDLIEFHAGPKGVYMELAAKDEDGQHYLAASGDVAVHRIAIKLDTLS